MYFIILQYVLMSEQI